MMDLHLDDRNGHIVHIAMFCVNNLMRFIPAGEALSFVSR